METDLAYDQIKCEDERFSPVNDLRISLILLTVQILLHFVLRSSNIGDCILKAVLMVFKLKIQIY